MSDSGIHHRRFFVPAERIQGERVEFEPAQAHQLAHVLRLRAGERVAVFDGTGRELTASLVEATPRRATAVILGEAPGLPAPRPAITLAQVVPRGGAMDWIVAKATELGVARIVPLEGRQSVRRGSARGPRWQRILQEAAEQCGRSDLPALAPPATLEAFLREEARAAPLLVCHPGATARALRELCGALAGVPALALLVGAEGGFSPDEVGAIELCGARLVSLGPRLLRTDTAALAALAALQACLGDWGAVRAAP